MDKNEEIVLSPSSDGSDDDVAGFHNIKPIRLVVVDPPIVIDGGDDGSGGISIDVGESTVSSTSAAIITK